jgi:hypothetical protein
MYQLCLDRLGNTSTQFIRRLPEKDMIPVDPKNSDYQTYLKWLDGYEYMMTAPMQMEWVKTSPNGNTPLPADE